MSATSPLAAQSVLLNQVLLLSGSVAPNTGGGVVAGIGSGYLQTGALGVMWLKVGAAATAWQQMQQSYDWLSILDFGADPTGATDSTSAIQDAMNEANSNGGGVVYVPPGTFNFSALSWSGMVGVQMKGAGPASHLRWSAASPAGAGISFLGGAEHCVMELLQIDGSDLTGPSTANHLIQLGEASGGAVTDVQLVQLFLTGMPAGSGDGVHMVGDASDLVSVAWVTDCQINGCGRFGVGIEQGVANVIIGSNYLANCTTEIGVVATADQLTTALSIHNNILEHSGANRFAFRMEGDPSGLITQCSIANNQILGGFVTTQNMQDSAITDNVALSGAYASTDPAWKIYDACQRIAWSGNIVDRNSGASVGPCLGIEKSTTSPSQILATGWFINETVEGNFVTVVDATGITVNGQGLASNAGASGMYGVDVQAVTIPVTDVKVGPGFMMTAAAGTIAAAVRLLANGANVTNVQATGNSCDNNAYGLRCEIGSGGTFNGTVQYQANAHNGATGDVQLVGGAAPTLAVGINAAPKAVGAFMGSGSPAGVVDAYPGSLYLNESGGEGVSVFYKESGNGTSAGWIGLGESPIVFGCGDTTTGSGAVFMGPGFIPTASSADLQVAATRPGTVRNLYVEVEGAGTGAATNTYTVDKNGATTALATTASNTSTGSFSDTSDLFTVVAGDLLSLQVAKSILVVQGQQNVTGTIGLA